jgi:hypothetical protein
VRHPRVAGYAIAAWVVAVASALLAGGETALPWLLPIAAAATAALPLRRIRTLAWALPVAAVASVDPSAGWGRIAIGLAAVVAAIAAVGLLDVWQDARPAGPAALLDPAERPAWWAARWPGLVPLAIGLVAASAAWSALATVSWSPPGWMVATVPVAAVLAVGAATWSLWRPDFRV